MCPSSPLQLSLTFANPSRIRALVKVTHKQTQADTSSVYYNTDRVTVTIEVESIQENPALAKVDSFCALFHSLRSTYIQQPETTERRTHSHPHAHTKSHTLILSYSHTHIREKEMERATNRPSVFSVRLWSLPFLPVLSRYFTHLYLLSPSSLSSPSLSHSPGPTSYNQ